MSSLQHNIWRDQEISFKQIHAVDHVSALFVDEVSHDGGRDMSEHVKSSPFRCPMFSLCGETRQTLFEIRHVVDDVHHFMVLWFDEIWIKR